jgi:P-type Cu+ transporter
LPAANALRAVPGRGVEGDIDGARVRLASSRWLGELGLSAPAAMQQAAARHGEAGASLAWLLRDEAVIGLLAFADEAKPEAAAAIVRLAALGVPSVMISGDHRAAAEQVARALGIREVRAEVLPGAKADAVEALKATLNPGQKIAMVGDGINDAPALAAADIGIAMAAEGGGTDVAIETAGLTLLRGDVRLVPEAIELSRAIRAKLRQNLFWAFAYNVVGIPLAAFGLLSPMVAGAAMALSSLSVVSNALLLQRWRPKTG